jgi:hypothetical protein
MEVSDKFAEHFCAHAVSVFECACKFATYKSINLSLLEQHEDKDRSLAFCRLVRYRL